MLSPLHLAPLYAFGLPHVRTAQGWVVGSRAADGVERFAGIPFAEQPVGKLRFARASLSEVPFPGGVHDGRLPGPPCIQNPAGPIRAPGSEEPPQSEACLHLTLWRPAASQEPAAPLPVMVYIFGGGLCGGSANVVSLNASRLVVRQQVIVVSVSYRLGALGFCPLPDFPGGGSGGMNGIYDIIVALRWLKANVAPFGGDPGNVMLFGQSSGSYAICTLCVAPAAAGLFSKVALQSGPCLGGPPGRGWGPVTSVSPSAIAREVMAQLNVTSGIEGLRAVRDATRIQWPSRYMEDLDVAPYFSAYFPDDAVVRSPPADLWAAGAIHPRAMLVGGTSKDGTAAFYGTAPTLGNIAPDPAQLGDAAYETALKGAWGAAARAVRAHYPLSRFGGSAQAAFVQADADAYVLCPQTEAARMAVAAGVAVWHYEFSHFMPSPTAPGGGCDNGVELDVVEAGASATWATHGAEVRYVFGSEQNHDTLSGRPRIADCPFSPAERRLSDEIGAYWAGLARQGDPNSGGGAGGGRAWWPAYGAGANWTSLVLGVGGGVARAQLHGSACNFWTQLGGESTWSTWSAVINRTSRRDQRNK